MKTILKYDIVLQWRQGFWLVYSIFTVVYLAIIFNLPVQNRYFMSLVFILTDTSVLGLMFIGALVLLEKQQNILQVLWITPMRPEKYILSKTLSLTLLSLAMSSLLLFLPNGFRSDSIRVLVAVVLTSTFFTLLGMTLSARVKTLNGFLAAMMSGSLIAMIPIAPYLMLDQPFWLVVFPTNAALDLIWIEHLSVPRAWANIFVLLSWSFVAFRLAVMQYKIHILK